MPLQNPMRKPRTASLLLSLGLVGSALLTTTSPAHASAPERLAYWDLGADLQGADSWNDHDLTFSSEPEWTFDRFLICDGSYRLNGTSYGSTADSVIDTTESFTAMTWVRLDSAAADQTVLSQAGTDSDLFDLSFSATDRAWSFSMPHNDRDDAHRHRAVSPEPVDEQVWYHLAAVYDRENREIRLYVDGAPVASSVLPGNRQFSAGPFVIGSSGDATATTTGHIDSARAYSGVVEEETITMLSSRRPTMPLDPDGSICDPDDPW
ncbi:LamG domain-containing protein [Salininema proteolyticum]|uniref:LamG domain-containing protein n=1 Tax=Salininema proteolyticum TaxID=1607685 RepID=A0ABV8U1T3_9ACTN